MKNHVFCASTLGLFLILPFSVRAADGPAVPAVPAAQSQAFALGYTLRACDLRAIAFTHSVKSLSTVDDDQAAGGEIAHLSEQATALRHTQAISYSQIARLLTKMGGPQILRSWATQTAARLESPPAYSEETKALAKREPDTAAVTAELEEIKTVKTAADAHLPSLAAWLNASGGPLAVWTAEVGTYAADLRAAATSPGQEAPSIRTARHLLQNAPPHAPSAARENLAGIIPPGGNLSDLAVVSPLTVSPEKMNSLFEGLLALYVPRKTPETRP